jgi:starvation-inducible DNA-binding protein
MARKNTPSAGLAGVNGTAVGKELQDTLVELTDLALRGKQAHWNVVGPHFTSVHEQLDVVIAAVRLASDEVAERAVALGYAPDGRAATVAKSTPLPEFPAGQVTVGEVIEHITDALAAVCGHLRERVERLQELDLVSQDLLIGHLATLEKHHWMFAVQRVPDPATPR